MIDLNEPRGARGDIPAQRIIPPSIRAFLNDRRIDPVTRAFLLGIAGKKREDWTFLDLQQVTAVVPSLTEIYIGTAVLSEFYEFMNLDPASLFEPQLGASWQATSTAFDPRNARNRRCFNLRNQAVQDPGGVRLDELLNCGGQLD
ncbi:hypothetical protein [Muricoccus vinaceus]|uniref:Uncharacterized protein n=1 Tax=Muricoccus vinaceus TaxID=424704 RepID=A0ABV6IXW5_9PROT